MKKKIAFGIGLGIAMALVYFTNQPRLYLGNEPATNMAIKIYPFGDSVIVYVPYELAIYNNRLISQEITSVLDDGYDNRWGNLLFNTDDVEIGRFYDPAYKDLRDHYFKLKYRQTIFPFTRRTFYYFRGHHLSQNELETSVAHVSRARIQLQDLAQHFELDIDQLLIDSLYKADDQKRFNLCFSERNENYGTTYIRAKINSDEQKLISINDSIKSRKEDEARAGLMEYMMRNIDDELVQF